MSSETRTTLRLSPEEVQDLMAKKHLSQKALLLNLVTTTAELARPPISKFHVGAAGVGKSGAIYLGINLEFPGGPLYNTVHAEQFLVANAIHHGETELLTIAVNAVPCGHCRQFFSELHNADTLKLLFKNDADTEYHLSELLPLRFKPQDVLGEDYTAVLMASREDLRLKLTKHAQKKIERHCSIAHLKRAADKTLEEACKSYAPYSKCPSAVSIITHDGGIFSGGCIENCAYNPSLQPLQSAIIHAIAQGRLDAYTEIVCLVLVELEGQTKVSQVAAVSGLLEAISPKAQLVTLTAERS